MSVSTTCSKIKIENLLDVISTISEKDQFDLSAHMGIFLYLEKIPPMKPKNPTAITAQCFVCTEALRTESLEAFCKNPFILAIIYDAEMQRDRYFHGQKNILNWNDIKDKVLSQNFTFEAEIAAQLKNTRSFLYYGLTSPEESKFVSFPLIIEEYSITKNKNKEQHNGFIMHSIEPMVEFYQKKIDNVRDNYVNTRKYNIFD